VKDPCFDIEEKQPEGVEYLDPCLVHLHQECPHGARNGAGCTDQRDRASGIHEHMGLGGNNAAEQVKSCIERPAPLVLDVAAYQPEEEHIEEHVEETAVHEHRGKVGKQLGIVRNKAIFIRGQGILDCVKLIDQFYEFFLVRIR